MGTPPGVDRQTPVKTVPSRRTTYAGGNNGFWSKWWSLTRGRRQGCCFSPAGFVQIVETLGIAIRSNVNITGIKIGDSEIKAGQFTDDLWTTLDATQESLNAMLHKLDQFYKFTGLFINPSKCTVLRLGPFKNSDAKFYTLKRLFWSPSSIRILGIQVHSDLQVIIKENYFDLLKKVEDIFALWSY